MKFSKIQLGRQGNFILGIILLYFVFFGYITNAYPRFYNQAIKKTVPSIVGQKLIFLYQILFNPSTFLSFIILFAIMFFVAFRESFYEYAIRNSIWYVPAIIIISWIWYWILYGFDASVFYIYFIRVEGYITILTLLCTNLFAAILASVTNEKRKLIMRQELEI
jgi:hypothetical protein